MEGISKEKARNMVITALNEVDEYTKEFEKLIEIRHDKGRKYFAELLSQIPQSVGVPLIAKTPKILRKKAPQIATIPEDSVPLSNNSNTDSLDEQITDTEVKHGRVKRKASQIADDNIRKQQSQSLSTKLRKPSSPSDENTVSAALNIKRAKRSKTSNSSSRKEDLCIKLTDIEDVNNKESKMSDVSTEKRIARSITLELEEEGSDHTLNEKSLNENEMPISQEEHQISESHSLVKRKREEQETSFCKSYDKTVHSNEPPNKKANTVNETIRSEMTEVSMYEDAVGKPNIMSSTMNSSALLNHKKIMNSTVILERLPLSKMMNNETFIVQASSPKSNSLSKKQNGSNTNKANHMTEKDLSLAKLNNENVQNDSIGSLITDDESSPERKEPKKAFKKSVKNLKTKKLSSDEDDDEDIVAASPAKNILRDLNSNKRIKDTKNNYKSNVLFSPYSTDSVKKRVEAYEQAVLTESPQPTESTETMRVTRTKTRALNAASSNENSNIPNDIENTDKSKMLRPVKETNDREETKENCTADSMKQCNTLQANEKLPMKQSQKIITPIGKSKIQIPMSVNRIQNTPLNVQILNSHTKSVTRVNNIVSHVESFIPKSATKFDTTEKLLQEKRKRADAEDAKRKKEEALKAIMEEKRKKREMKELKNKQAREAKERLDMERRLKAEKEKEEKARLAMHLQERQREEAERKKQAHLQRLQEKEERRKHEEQLRLQRLQEQEEAERQLAEQKRLEYEAEKRKLAEARAQQQAAEALRLKIQMQAKAKQQTVMTNKQGPTSYKLDSEPDDDESDDESKPKHEIPEWAKYTIRQSQLRMQMYVPNIVIHKLFNTRRCTPDLTELFHGISKNRLKRTSSAVWKTPPRFSMMED